MRTLTLGMTWMVNAALRRALTLLVTEREKEDATALLKPELDFDAPE